MNPYQIVREFENSLAEFVGSKYAVAVDNCTNALFLCCEWHDVQEVTIPARTYVSVPGAIIHAGGKVHFEDIEWSGAYQLKPYPIYDSACQLSKGMYIPDSFMCVSFSANKPINIGKGGMIFTDDSNAAAWFRLARFAGRREIPMLEDEVIMLGWNMYMTPEQAARGLLLRHHLKDVNVTSPTYPNLLSYKIFQSSWAT